MAIGRLTSQQAQCKAIETSTAKCGKRTCVACKGNLVIEAASPANRGPITAAFQQKITPLCKLQFGLACKYAP